ADRGGEGVVMRVGRAGLLEPVDVFLRIAELERVLAHFGRGQQLIAFVEQLREPHIGADAAVVFAARADVAVRLELAREQHVVAARALDPQIVGRLALLGEGGQRIADAGEPAHAFAFAAECTAAASSDVRRRTCSGAASPCSPISSTSAEPTTTPSATRAMAAACSGVRTPKPTATGRSVERLMRVTLASMESNAACCLPVMPATET